MADAVVIKCFGVRYGTLSAVLIGVLLAAMPMCWAAGHVYGIDKALASQTFWTIFTVVYLSILILPWINLAGQEHFTRAQRLNRMCLSWLCLNWGIRLVWDLPWVVFFKQIISANGCAWAYLWWSYMDGGDTRYAMRDPHLLVQEIGISISGIIGAFLLWRYYRSRRFTNAELMTIMVLMIGDFYSTYTYFATELVSGLQHVGGLGDLIIKFVLTNFLWIVMPWVVFLWAIQQLTVRKTT